MTDGSAASGASAAARSRRTSSASRCASHARSSSRMNCAMAVVTNTELPISRSISRTALVPAPPPPPHRGRLAMTRSSDPSPAFPVSTTGRFSTRATYLATRHAVTGKCRSHPLESNTEARDIPGRCSDPGREKENPRKRRHRPASIPEEVRTQVGTVPDFASAIEAMDMVRAGLGYLAAADATAMAAETQARCLRMLEQANSMGTAARASILGAFTAGQGYSRGRGLQPAGVADQPHAGHQGGRGGLHRVGPAGRSAPAGRGGAGGRGAVGVVRPDDLPVDGQAAGGLPGGRGRDLAGRGGRRRGPAGPGRAGRGDLRPVPARGPGQQAGAGVRGPVGAAGDHVRAAPGCCRGSSARSAPRSWARCWTRCRPRPGAEDTRTQAQRYHDALHEALQRLVDGRAAAGAGRAAGQGLGAHVPGRPDGPGRQLGAAGGVDQPGPGAVGRAPGGGLGRRR